MKDEVWGWCYSRLIGWQYLLLYYKNKTSKKIKSQRVPIFPMFYTSGFISKNRGLHWNRYNRLKNK